MDLQRTLTRLVGTGTLVVAVLAAALAVASSSSIEAHAQISGIERGGGVDRPYVPPRRRLNNPRTKTPKPVKAKPGEPEVVDAAMVEIPEAAAKRYEAGREAYGRGELEKAIDEFEAAIRIESRYVDALIDLGDARFDRADLDESIDAYERALVLDKGNIDAHFRLGRVSYARRDYDTALTEYRKVLEERPRDPEATYNLALTYKALKRYEDAIPYFEKAIDLRTTDFPEARINLSRSYFESDQLEKAEEEARKAIKETGETTSESANAWYALATALGKRADLGGAADALKRAIDACRECPPDQVSKYYYAIAQVYESKGDYANAADSYERFLQLAPFVPEYQIQTIRERIVRMRSRTAGQT